MIKGNKILLIKEPLEKEIFKNISKPNKPSLKISEPKEDYLLETIKESNCDTTTLNNYETNSEDYNYKDFMILYNNKIFSNNKKTKYHNDIAKNNFIKKKNNQQVGNVKRKNELKNIGKNSSLNKIKNILLNDIEKYEFDILNCINCMYNNNNFKSLKDKLQMDINTNDINILGNIKYSFINYNNHNSNYSFEREEENKNNIGKIVNTHLRNEKIIKDISVKELSKSKEYNAIFENKKRKTINKSNYNNLYFINAPLHQNCLSEINEAKPNIIQSINTEKKFIKKCYKIGSLINNNNNSNTYKYKTSNYNNKMKEKYLTNNEFNTSKILFNTNNNKFYYTNYENYFNKYKQKISINDTSTLEAIRISKNKIKVKKNLTNMIRLKNNLRAKMKRIIKPRISSINTNVKGLKDKIIKSTPRRKSNDLSNSNFSFYERIKNIINNSNKRSSIKLTIPNVLLNIEEENKKINQSTAKKTKKKKFDSLFIGDYLEKYKINKDKMKTLEQKSSNKFEKGEIKSSSSNNFKDKLNQTMKFKKRNTFRSIIFL